MSEHTLHPTMRPKPPREDKARVPYVPRPSKSTWRGVYVHGPKYGLSAQQVVVKTSFTRPSARGFRSMVGMTAQKLRYLRRDGREHPGEHERELPMYTTTQEKLSEQERREFAARTEHDKHQWSLVLSPEHGKQLNLTTFTRRFMAQVEHDQGHALDWVAVNHYDTAHPHTHVVLRGRTLDNEQEVTFKRDYITHGMPYRGRDIATEMLGPREIRLVEHERILERTEHHAHELEMLHEHRTHLEQEHSR